VQRERNGRKKKRKVNTSAPEECRQHKNVHFSADHESLGALYAATAVGEVGMSWAKDDPRDLKHNGD
jgi:hypothetical protein